ncbi:MAG: MaoC family dehydratase N-terminal domain-containing protein [Clostridia bacterium]|nr:MaoC family dehydratase N-terminal domain-containing protein [Clostridia bacterium]
MYFDDIKLDTIIEIDEATIEKDRMLDFAYRYDNVPLHTDEEYAKSTPFKGLIAPGVMSFMEVWANYLKVDIFGDELIAGKSTKIEWLRPVYAGDRLKGVGRISALTPKSVRSGIVELTIDAYNQDGVLVLTSTTEAVVKRKN